MAISLKIIGIVLFVAGLVLTCKPNLISKISVQESGYQMIEMRVKWGFIIGLGLYLFFFNDWNSWKSVLSALLFFVTLGIIISRLSGFVLDGFFIKQLFWLAP